MLGPTASEALREHLFRIPDDVLVARIWFLAVGAPGGDRWLDAVLLADDR
ncbi:MAG TPA: hypothetical protein VK935_00010 [Actinomycetospora sp.]|nr:hypothetical protein [Actinomycetospora sp.]